MPIMRNPFRKQDENARPLSANVDYRKNNTETTKSIGIEDQRSAEYPLSEINDSGVFVPPSPPQRKAFWSTNSTRSTTSSIHRCAFDENEQFNISRESFDSYRRSFDISARSPIPQSPETRYTRGSLDIRTFDHTYGRSSLDARSLNPPPPRTSNSFQRPSQVPAETQEEEADEFEDIDIAESKPQPPKKRGIFARMVDGGDAHNERPISSGADGSKSSWHHFATRKRGQSGQGAELGAVPARVATPKTNDSRSRKNSQAQKPIAISTEKPESKAVTKEQSLKDDSENTAKQPVVSSHEVNDALPAQRTVVENSRAQATT